MSILTGKYGWPGGKYFVFTQQIHLTFCEKIWFEHLRKSKWWPRLLKIHQLHPTTPGVQTCQRSSPDKKKMAGGLNFSDYFSDYIERVVGEINFNFISIQIIFTTVLR